MTRDGGATWTSVERRLPGVPADTWIPAIEASPHDAGHGVRRLRRPPARRTSRRTSTAPTTSARPGGASRRPELRGYALVDRAGPGRAATCSSSAPSSASSSRSTAARSWTCRSSTACPTVSVMDLAIHPREHDLVIGTHGRGALRPRRHLAAARTRGEGAAGAAPPLPGGGPRASTGGSPRTAASASAPASTAARTAPTAPPSTSSPTATTCRSPTGSVTASVASPSAAGRRSGSRAGREGRSREERRHEGEERRTARAKAEKAQPTRRSAKAAKATSKFSTPPAQRVRRLKVDAQRGLNRVYWDFSRDAFKSPPSASPEETEAIPAGPQVPPGRYEIVLTLGGEERRTSVNVLADPTAGNSAEDWRRAGRRSSRPVA